MCVYIYNLFSVLDPGVCRERDIGQCTGVFPVSILCGALSVRGLRGKYIFFIQVRNFKCPVIFPHTHSINTPGLSGPCLASAILWPSSTPLIFTPNKPYIHKDTTSAAAMCQHMAFLSVEHQKAAKSGIFYYRNEQDGGSRDASPR